MDNYVIDIGNNNNRYEETHNYLLFQKNYDNRLRDYKSTERNKKVKLNKSIDNRIINKNKGIGQELRENNIYYEKGNIEKEPLEKSISILKNRCIFAKSQARAIRP